MKRSTLAHCFRRVMRCLPALVFAVTLITTSQNYNWLQRSDDPPTQSDAHQVHTDVNWNS
jgi:hypothetical protein